MTRRFGLAGGMAAFLGLILFCTGAQAVLVMHVDPGDTTRLFEDDDGTSVGGHNPIDAPYSGEFVRWVQSVGGASPIVAQQANAPPIVATGPTAGAPYVLEFTNNQNLLVLGSNSNGDLINAPTEFDHDTMTVVLAGRPNIGTTGTQTFINFNYGTATNAGGPDLVSLEYNPSSQKLIARASGGSVSTTAIAGQWFVAELKWSSSSGMSLSVNGGTPLSASSAAVTAPNFDRFRLGRTAANTGTLNGQIGDVYLYDSAAESTSALITQLLADYPIVSAPLLHVNRATGAISLEYSGAPTTLIGYSITSTAGGLLPSNWTSIADNYDMPSGPTPGNGSVDPNDAWSKLTNPALRTDLSEFDPDGNGATLTNGQVIQLGNSWIRSPLEDLKAQILLSDGTLQDVAVLMEGNGGNALPYGDLDLDGDFDVSDFRNVFTVKYGTNTTAMSGVEKYLNGDFNSDGVSDFIDYLIYRQAYQTAHPGAGALEWGSVPEPSIAMFTLIAAVALAFRRSASRKVFVAGLALFAVLNVAERSSADLVAHYDPNVLTTMFQDGNNVGGTVAVTTVGQPVRYITDVRSPTPGHQAQNAPDAFPDAQQANTAATLASVTGGTVLRFSGNGNLLGFDADNNAAAGSLTGLRTQMDRNTLTLIIAGQANTVATGIGTFLDMRQSSPLISGAFGLQYDNVSKTLQGLVSGTALASTSVAQDQFFVASLAWNGASSSATLKVNVIGNSTSTTAAASSTAVDINNYRFGSQANTATVNQLNGLIGDVYLYNDVLDHSDVFTDLVNQYLPTLTLEVNKTTGFVTLKNTSGTSFSIDGYQIKSTTTGSLNPANGTGWSSMHDQNFSGTPGNPVWSELGANINELSEGYIDGTSLFAPGSSLSLGKAYNTLTAGTDLTFAFHTSTNGLVTMPGVVSYVTGGGLPGDFNLDGKVDAADYVTWRKTDGTPAGYALWRANFGTGAGSGSNLSNSAAVPEPAALTLLGLAAAVLGSRRFRRLRTVVAAGCCVALTTSVASALVTNDRVYSFGDDSLEQAAANITIGSGPGNITPNATLDSQGPSNSYVDLTVSGTPTYISVSDRPGAAPGTLGASFNGIGARLSTFSVNQPTTYWDNATFFPGGYPLNYENIFSHGMQVWAKPDSTMQNVLQAVVSDTVQNGILITATNTWALQFNNTTVDSTVPVAFNQWSHVMELGGINDRVKGLSSTGGALLVNGVAVAASSATFASATTNLTVASNTAGTGAFYKGSLDDLKIFLWGNNTGQSKDGSPPSGANWGTLNLGTDNEWIAAQLASLGVTNPADANMDGTISGDGTGPAATDDATFFIQHWLNLRQVNNVTVGDWISRQNGDLNYDGRTDMLDALMLHNALIGSGSGSGLDFSKLGGQVPEPSSLSLLALAAGALMWRGRDRRRHTETFATGKPSHLTRQRAFTLVELLVVIAIIGVLVAILLPAVQAAREAARRSSCVNNFHQTAVAVHNYLDVKKNFGPGATYSVYMNDPGIPAGTTANMQGLSWSTYILPFIEQQQIYDLIDSQTGFNHSPGNWAAVAINVPTYICPSKSNNETGWTDHVSGAGHGGDPNADLRPTNIVGVMGYYPFGKDDPYPLTLNKATFQSYQQKALGNGIYYNLSHNAIKHVTDGTSKTLLLGETTGSWGKDNDGNVVFIEFSWITRTCQSVDEGINGPFTEPGGRPRGLLMGASGQNRHSELNDQFGFSSFHPGGCHFALADASVQFLSEDIDQDVLDEMASRNDGGTPYKPPTVVR